MNSEKIPTLANAFREQMQGLEYGEAVEVVYVTMAAVLTEMALADDTPARETLELLDEFNDEMKLLYLRIRKQARTERDHGKLN